MYEILKIPVDCKLFPFAYYLKDNRYCWKNFSSTC